MIPNIKLPSKIPNKIDCFVGHEELIDMIFEIKNIVKRKYNMVQAENKILIPEKIIFNMLLKFSFAKAAIP